MRRNDSSSTRQVFFWLLSYSAVSRWMTCMCFSVWHSVREPATEKLLDQKKKKKKKENDTWKWEKYSVYYSVGDMLSDVTYSYGNIQNKMCKTVSHTVLWALLFSLTSFKYHFNSLIICSLLHCWKVTLVLKWEIPVLWKRTRTDWQCDITDQVSV